MELCIFILLSIGLLSAFVTGLAYLFESFTTDECGSMGLVCGFVSWSLLILGSILYVIRFLL